MSAVNIELNKLSIDELKDLVDDCTAILHGKEIVGLVQASAKSLAIFGHHHRTLNGDLELIYDEYNDEVNHSDEIEEYVCSCGIKLSTLVLPVVMEFEAPLLPKDVYPENDKHKLVMCTYDTSNKGVDLSDKLVIECLKYNLPEASCGMCFGDKPNPRGNVISGFSYFAAYYEDLPLGAGLVYDTELCEAMILVFEKDGSFMSMFTLFRGKPKGHIRGCDSIDDVIGGIESKYLMFHGIIFESYEIADPADFAINYSAPKFGNLPSTCIQLDYRAY